MGHNLMLPHVMLHREPLISVLDGVNEMKTTSRKTGPQAEGNLPDKGFHSYIGQLLGMPGEGSNLGLLSPTATESKSPEIARGEIATMEEAITLAIQQNNSAKPSKLSTTRFEITRSSDRIAVIMLARPAYRLGEVVPITVDFQQSDIHCFSLHATLETAEHIDPSIALRSQASISRITRKIHSIQRESTISATRVVFNLAVPSNSTPEFITSGVRLDWSLRFEFVTGSQVDFEEATSETPQALLEEVAEDERGSILAAVQAMPCETFDVSLPIQIYGAISDFDDSYRTPEAAI